MIRRCFLVLACMILFVTMAVPAYAADQNETIYSSITVLENGITVTDEIIDISQARSTDKSYNRKVTYTDDGTVIAVIAFTATYRYDGTTVSVVAKSVTQTDTYDGWSFTQQSFTSSGGTVTLTGKLSKWLILNNSVSISMTCDKNGNISYT